MTKKAKTLWLTRTNLDGYELWDKEPTFHEDDEIFWVVRNKDKGVVEWSSLESFIHFFPQFKLRKDEKAKLVPTKTGLRIVRRKKP